MAHEPTAATTAGVTPRAPSGRLTVHVLDTARGRPAAGVPLALFRLDGAARIALVAARTNQDGRCDAPLLSGAELRPGGYEVVFEIAAWREANCEEPGFYDTIPLRFRVTDPHAHYHIPLLLSPFGYTTYRGS
jgi:5-hydroxyisourate hydrolase